MVINNLQTEFRLLVAIVHTRDSNNIAICAQVPRLHREIFMRACMQKLRVAQKKLMK